MRNDKFCSCGALFCTTCTNTMVNFLLRRCLKDVNTGTNLISSLSLYLFILFIYYNLMAVSKVKAIRTICESIQSIKKYTCIIYVKKTDKQKKHFL